jgi:hypothetical protein
MQNFSPNEADVVTVLRPVLKLARDEKILVGDFLCGFEGIYGKALTLPAGLYRVTLRGINEGDWGNRYWCLTVTLRAAGQYQIDWDSPALATVGVDAGVVGVGNAPALQARFTGHIDKVSNLLLVELEKNGQPNEGVCQSLGRGAEIWWCQSGYGDGLYEIRPVLDLAAPKRLCGLAVIFIDPGDED